MAIDTGKILDAAVISKLCKICNKSLVDKSSSAYAAWKTKHREKGKCLCNHEGPSTNMETAAAKMILSCSVEKHKMRYSKILSNGDNKTI